MAVSKKRKKKNGKEVKHDPYKRESGLTLQDLINVVAYQEVHGITGHDLSDTRDKIDFTDPSTQAVIKAVEHANIIDAEFSENQLVAATITDENGDVQHITNPKEQN